MPEKFKVGCVRPTIENQEVKEDIAEIKEEVKKSMVQVGKKAPDFTLSGHQNGEFFNFKLSDYRKMGCIMFLSW